MIVSNLYCKSLISANYFGLNQYSICVFAQKSLRIKIHQYENQWLLTFDLWLSNDAVHRVWGPIHTWRHINFCTCCHIIGLLFLFVRFLQHRYRGKPTENFSFPVFVAEEWVTPQKEMEPVELWWANSVSSHCNVLFLESFCSKQPPHTSFEVILFSHFSHYL